MDVAREVDMLVVGGGINGAGIARDAAGRGFSVLLCEQDDLASHTSSASTKLIHGGLRYLEQYEFRLVAKALAEREVILRLAPHIAWPMLFVLPHESHLRPAWMIRLGLLLYDHLGPEHRILADSHAVDLHEHVSGAPLLDRYRRGFVYSDGWVQDARLVVLNAMDARERGATVLTRTRCMRARAGDGRWTVDLATPDGNGTRVRTRMLVNACGPWAGRFLGEVLGRAEHRRVRLVKGSHIVLPRLFEHDHAYIFQQPDRRVVFAIPYEGRFTLVGTTDVDVEHDSTAPHIDADETAYLCNAVNRYFRHRVTPADVVWSYSGVRPLVDQGGDASAVSRDYLIELEDVRDALLLNVFGGKITTFRRLAEEAVDRLAEAAGAHAPSWTARGDPLPGGDFADAERLLQSWTQRWPWMPAGLLHRWLRHYGTRTDRIVGRAKSLQALGRHFGGELYQAEVDYLRQHEWAATAGDILWRRTKLGLHLDPETCRKLDNYLADTEHAGGRSTNSVGEPGA